MAVVNRDEANLDEIDKGIKNNVCWNWLEKSVIVDIGEKEPVTAVLAECIRKIDKYDKVLCIFYNDFVRYASQGCKNIEDHMKTKKHVADVKTWLTILQAAVVGLRLQRHPTLALKQFSAFILCLKLLGSQQYRSRFSQIFHCVIGYACPR